METVGEAAIISIPRHFEIDHADEPLFLDCIAMFMVFSFKAYYRYTIDMRCEWFEPRA